MPIKNASVKIEGQSPLLMHSFPMTETKGIEKLPREEQAEMSTYRDPDGKLFVPGVNVQRCLVSAARYSKGKGRASLEKNVAACVLVTPERLLLNQDQYAVDSRPVVIQATKGRILRHRPRFDKWELEFEIEWDLELLSEKEIRQIVDDAGKRVGLLDFRPEKKGPFGRFIVTAWKAL